MEVYNAAKRRLEAFGYAFKDGDAAILELACGKAVSFIKNDCNIAELPEGLLDIAADMAAGEFLLSKKTFAPEDIAGLDLSAASVKQIRVGDTLTAFGEGVFTPEQRLDALINSLRNGRSGELSCYRKIRW